MSAEVTQVSRQQNNKKWQRGLHYRYYRFRVRGNNGQVDVIARNYTNMREAECGSGPVKAREEEPGTTPGYGKILNGNGSSLATRYGPPLLCETSILVQREVYAVSIY